MRDIAARRVRVVEVEHPQPSPFARSLLFGYVAQFLYEGDSPLAERRAAALALDPSLLAELLGRARAPRCATCSTRTAVERTERELQRLTPERAARARRGRRRPAARARPADHRRGGGAVRPGRRAGGHRSGSRRWRRRGG